MSKHRTSSASRQSPARLRPRKPPVELSGNHLVYDDDDFTSSDTASRPANSKKKHHLLSSRAKTKESGNREHDEAKFRAAMEDRRLIDDDDEDQDEAEDSTDDEDDEGEKDRKDQDHDDDEDDEDDEDEDDEDDEEEDEDEEDKASSDVPPEHLPAALKIGGGVESALEAGKARAAGDDSALELVKDMREELKRLRFDTRWGSWKTGDGPESLNNLYDSILIGEIEKTRPVAQVLRRVLALREEFSVPEHAAWKAEEAYRERRKAYDLVLGDFIPAGLRIHVANAAYVNNENKTALDDWSAFQQRLQTDGEQPLLGIGTGLASFDGATGGFQNLTLLAGETGVGKSTMGLNLGVGAIRQNADTAVLFFTLEMSKDTLYARLLSQASGVPYAQVKRPQTAEHKERLAAADERLKHEVLPRLRIIEWRPCPEFPSLTIGIMKKHIQEMRNRPQVNRVLVILDPLQKFAVPHPDARTDFTDRNDTPLRPLTDLDVDEERMRTLMELQEWTRRSDVPGGDPILVVSGVRKPDSHRKRLTLADVRGRYETVCDAHCVLFLEPQVEMPSINQEVVPVFLNVAKARDGGQQGDIELDFHHTISTFRERVKGTGKATATVGVGAGKPQGRKKRFAGK